ncbi:MAG: hypothetical protein Q4D04_02125, partial [Clostridia bacterium]|nr:hypothetical protein [Clostridia bacterium]
MLLLLMLAVPAMAAQSDVLKVDYDLDDGKVEVEFIQPVKYDNATFSVTVKDGMGETCQIARIERDDDDVSFYMINPARGASYTIVITGIATRDSAEYASVTAGFTVPAISAAPTVKTARYEGGKVEVEFVEDVYYGSAFAVTVKDGDGADYQIYGIDRDDDEVSFYLQNPSAGKAYAVTIAGVAVRGASEFTTVVANFAIPAQPEVSATPTV